MALMCRHIYDVFAHPLFIDLTVGSEFQTLPLIVKAYKLNINLNISIKLTIKPHFYHPMQHLGVVVFFYVPLATFSVEISEESCIEFTFSEQ